MRTGVLARRVSLRRKPKADPVTPELRLAVYERDQGCVGAKCFDGRCEGRLELDHVRASHALGLRSRSTLDNLVALCTRHHEWKTTHGREARPILLAYLTAISEHVHVDFVNGCSQCLELYR